MLGLDNAGKTVMIQALCAESDVRFSSPIRGISFKALVGRQMNMGLWIGGLKVFLEAE